MHCHVHWKVSTFLHVRWHFNITIKKNYGRSIGIWKEERNWYIIERQNAVSMLISINHNDFEDYDIVLCSPYTNRSL